MNNDRQIAIEYILRYIGKPYIWGGDDPLTGFDCSGLALEYCKAGGLVHNDFDTTAEGLNKLFPRVQIPYLGCLAFYENLDKKIIHVSICLNERLSLTASGGGSKTLYLADAIRDDAFVKIRDMNYRSGLCAFNDPFFERSPI